MSSCWCNGRWVEDGQLSVSTGDRGLLHGLGLFETILAVDGAPIFLERHLARLQRALERLGWCVDPGEAVAAMPALLARAGVQQGKAAIRLALSAGSGSLRDTCRGDDAMVWMKAMPYAAGPESLSVGIAPWRRNEHSPLSGLKCASYAENLLVLDWARRQGLDEAILLNQAGVLCEAATANVFLVRDGILHTPELSSGCLPGITRGLLLEWAPTLGLECREGRLTPGDLETCDELLLTSAVRGVVPVSACEGRQLAQGSVTRRLRDVWEKKLKS